MHITLYYNRQPDGNGDREKFFTNSQVNLNAQSTTSKNLTLSSKTDEKCDSLPTLINFLVLLIDSNIIYFI